MTKADVESTLIELRDGIRVLRNEAVENRRVLRLLAGVLSDIQMTAEGLRQELAHVRTSRERTERAAAFAELAVAAAEKPAPEGP